MLTGGTIRNLATQNPSARVELLDSCEAGLTEAAAAARLERFGPNVPSRPAGEHAVIRFARNFTHTLALLLWFAAGLAFAAGIVELGAAILAVVVVNGVFAFVQEYRAGRVVAALMREVAMRTTVRRDGHERSVHANEVVPGDVVRLTRGDLAPADCLVIAADTFTVDLSSVTGESIPVDRTPDAVRADVAVRASLHDLPCFLPASSVVVTGTADAIVAATGAASTVGRIAGMVERIGDEASVLERQVDALSRFTAVAAVLAGTLTLVIAGASTEVAFISALTFATGVIVALVPEGLLPTLSVSLAIGAERMAKRGAAIRRLSAVESVGSVTVICTDKTGTLTGNVLTVIGTIANGASSEPTIELLQATALACEGDRGGNGDPIDVACLEWTRGYGQDHLALIERYPRISATPFDARRRYTSVTHVIETEQVVIAKGAPEAIAALAGADVTPGAAAEMEAAAAQGDRLLMIAARKDQWRVLGVLRLSDPLRSEAPAAIAACHAAGIRIVMITGDHPITAREVARQAGLRSNSVRTGAELDVMEDEELLEALQGDSVFARTDPDQKLRIARLLQQAGEVVVMTGDGINDAPALQAADVGVAMGKRGTEVAKRAADIVLADDNFATIVAAIEEGRSIKENIRRFASYVFTSNVAEVLPFILFILLPIPLPLAVIQVLAIDLGTDLMPALALGAEQPSPRLMTERPEPPDRPLLTMAIVLKTFAFFGVIEAALGLGAFLSYFAVEGWRPLNAFDAFVHVEGDARALTFLGIIAGQIGCVIAERDGALLSRLSPTSNPWVLVGVIVEIATAVVLVYVPGLNAAFEMDAVAVQWMLVLPAGAALFVGLDVMRRALSAAATRLHADANVT